MHINLLVHWRQLLFVVIRQNYGRKYIILQAAEMKSHHRVVGLSLGDRERIAIIWNKIGIEALPL